MCVCVCVYSMSILRDGKKAHERNAYPTFHYAGTKTVGLFWHHASRLFSSQFCSHSRSVSPTMKEPAISHSHKQNPILSSKQPENIAACLSLTSVSQPAKTTSSTRLIATIDLSCCRTTPSKSCMEKAGRVGRLESFLFRLPSPSFEGV